MANEYFVNHDDIAEMADAIRTSFGSTSSLVFPEDFIYAVKNLGVSPTPIFEYDGTYTVIDEGDGNWSIKFHDTGNLRFKRTTRVDLFLVGAGGAGGAHTNGGQGGGGGGYTQTYKGIVIEGGTDYTIQVGAGVSGADGGSSTAFGQTANGGKVGGFRAGGAGGSGGGAGGASNKCGSGGSNGSSGGNGSDDGGNTWYGGSGQGRNTYEFGESSRTLYSGGGGGGSWGDGGASGGSGGGGRGNSSSSKNGTKGTDGRGGGGGGGGRNATSARGGSGIVIIRNERG